MKLRTNKFIAVLCLVAMVASMIVPMFAITANAAGVDATLTFAKTNRTSWSASQQTWEQNGIKLVNDKGSSTSNVADYGAPARFYKSSKITVEAPGIITKIVFDCNSGSYATALKSSITASTATIAVSSDKVTVEPTAEATTFVIASLTGGQVRMDSMTVTYVEAGQCAHGNETNATVTTPATCTTAGERTFVCGDCGETIVEEITATGHNYVSEVCTVCSAEQYPEMTIAEALKLKDGEGFTLKNAVVTKVVSSWNTQYNNMDVNITDESGATILLWRAAVKLEVGNVVNVKGFKKTYNTTIEVDEKAKVELVANTTEIKAYGAQLLAGTTATSETTAVRLVLKLTSTKEVANIGAALEVNAAVTANSAKQSTTTVYSSINAGNYVVEAEEGSVFVLVEIYNIDNASFDEVIHVKPFMTVGDAELYGAEVTFSVNELLAKSAN